MKCPYCAEEVSDEAVVCKTCCRDLSLVKSLYEQIAQLEAELASVTTTPLPEPSGAAASTLAAVPDQTKYVNKSIFAIVFTAVGSVTCYWFFFQNDFSGPRILFQLSIAFPVIGGFFTGLSIRGRHFRLYCFLGLIIGILDYIGVWQVYQPWHLAVDWDGVLAYLVGQPILFAFSALMADWIEGRLLHQPLGQHTSLRFATALAKLSGSTRDRAKEIEFWKALIGLLTPFLTLVGTIITAYLTYLAALAKK